MDKIKKAGVIVDKYPNCQGIQLDKEELDKIIQKRKKLYKEKWSDWILKDVVKWHKKLTDKLVKLGYKNFAASKLK